jgi:membrane protein implicated in regulation of membrane protease activity
MLELLNQTILWWHWIILGLVLLIIEVNSGTFLFLGLGVAAIVIGVVDYLLQSSLSFELFSWGLLSVLYFIAWKKWFKETPISNIGQSDDALHTQGHVTKAINPTQRGEVAFDAPVLGDTTWVATAKEPIEVGTRVMIVDIRGHLIEVIAIEETTANNKTNR